MSNAALSADLLHGLFKTLPADEQTRFAAFMPGATAPQPPPKLLTMKEVAARFAPCTVRTVQRWVAMGELPAIKRGRLVRIPETALYEMPSRAGRRDHEE
jgi:excisionase family DNA binding protein